MKKYTSKKKHPTPGSFPKNGFTIGRDGAEFDAFKGDCPSRASEPKTVPTGSSSEVKP